MQSVKITTKEKNIHKTAKHTNYGLYYMEGKAKHRNDMKYKNARQRVLCKNLT